MSKRSGIMAALLLSLCLGFTVTVQAADYAGAVSAYRHAHGQPAVKLDTKLNAVALKQAQAMATTGSISHSVVGSLPSRVASLRRRGAAENIGAGFVTFAEM